MELQLLKDDVCAASMALARLQKHGSGLGRAMEHWLLEANPSARPPVLLANQEDARSPGAPAHTCTRLLLLTTPLEPHSG